MLLGLVAADGGGRTAVNPCTSTSAEQKRRYPTGTHNTCVRVTVVVHLITRAPRRTL